MKAFFEEFRKFIAKGNAVDMAVAVVVGGAFGKIVTSLVNDLLMPLIGLVTGGLSVSDWKWVISPAVTDASGTVVTAEAALRYGLFLQTVLDFLIVSLCIFLLLRVLLKAKAKLQKPAPAAPETPKAPTEAELLTEIRDLLKAQTDSDKT